jgi:hypothetical protein
MSRKIFGEFIEFFLKGLNHFKIQTSFKLEFLLEFLIQNPKGFGSWAKKESCSIWRNISPCLVLYFKKLSPLGHQEDRVLYFQSLNIGKVYEYLESLVTKPVHSCFVFSKYEHWKTLWIFGKFGNQAGPHDQCGPLLIWTSLRPPGHAPKRLDMVPTAPSHVVATGLPPMPPTVRTCPAFHTPPTCAARRYPLLSCHTDGKLTFPSCGAIALLGSTLCCCAATDDHHLKYYRPQAFASSLSRNDPTAFLREPSRSSRAKPPSSSSAECLHVDGPLRPRLCLREHHPTRSTSASTPAPALIAPLALHWHFDYHCCRAPTLVRPTPPRCPKRVYPMTVSL